MPQKIVPVILCGGSGTRLWPASREYHPKQFLPLVDENSLLQNTMQRALRICGGHARDVVTVTHQSLADEVRAQLAAIDPAATSHVLSEPSARNTAAAVAYAAAYVEKAHGADTHIWILPADHHIGDEEEMASAFRHALQASEKGYLVTFGIRPTRPETGYGYIKLGDPLQQNRVYHADSFVEKPDLHTASNYVSEGNYLWNSGMFLFSTERVLSEYAEHAPSIIDNIYLALDKAEHPSRVANDYYSAIQQTPFDKAIMEKSSRVAIVPCNPVWSDIGSWESLWEISEKDPEGNAIAGNAVCQSTYNCLIHADKKLIACAGLENLVVIDTGDALLIANRSDGDAMKSLVNALKGAGYAETKHPPPVTLHQHVSTMRTA